MSKAEETKAYIIQQSAALFNQKGFAGLSMSDIMQATGLKKGGIYNHFSSKDELVLAAFDHVISVLGQRYLQAIQSRQDEGAIAQLNGILDVFEQNMQDEMFKGGCPLLNTATESDDTHPALRERTQQAIGRWHQSICQVVRQGVKQGELQPDADPDAVATVLIAVLEGAVMMTKLYDDARYVRHSLVHLREHFDKLAKSGVASEKS
ncbi:MAG: TetR/AcrR family transcriptional regulator [Cyanothece sp. SIO2G6]|nr:TetR/AcrR family transcriptional regulator [Cyanothece sp. SIO2G6]